MGYSGKPGVLVVQTWSVGCANLECWLC